MPAALAVDGHWGVKEALRALLASSSLTEAHEQKMRLGAFVLAANMPETDRLWATITGWWEAIEVLVEPSWI